jgi:hypothetical protein
MGDNKIDHVKGRSLVWVLSQIRGMVEAQAVERLDQRLEEPAPASKANPMATRFQIAKLARRIEA